jgi:hypothetical protein
LDEALIEAPARTDDEPRFLVGGLHEARRANPHHRWFGGRATRRSRLMKRVISTRNSTRARMSPATSTGERRAPISRSSASNVDFRAWVVEALDREARRLGVTRQALVKLRIAERLEKAT